MASIKKIAGISAVILAGVLSIGGYFYFKGKKDSFKIPTAYEGVIIDKDGREFGVKYSEDAREGCRTVTRMVVTQGDTTYTFTDMTDRFRINGDPAKPAELERIAIKDDSGEIGLIVEAANQKTVYGEKTREVFGKCNPLYEGLAKAIRAEAAGNLDERIKKIPTFSPKINP